MVQFDERAKKRSIVVAVYIAIAIFIWFIIHLIITPAGTCFDGKKNQAETGIDCGGPCKICTEIKETLDIQIEEKAFAPGGSNLFDVVAKINNPNDAIGASSFDYTFNLLDQSGNSIATKSGSSFILPADQRYVAELAIETKNNAAPASVEFSITNVKWTKLSYAEKPQFTIFNQEFGPSRTGVSGSEGFGVLRNDSIYDLVSIKVISVVRDSRDAIVGIGTTQLNTVRSKEEREVHFVWPFMTGNEDIQKIDIEAQSNVLDVKAFVPKK
jgi:hypothetical protein